MIVLTDIAIERMNQKFKLLIVLQKVKSQTQKYILSQPLYAKWEQALPRKKLRVSFNWQYTLKTHCFSPMQFHTAF